MAFENLQEKQQFFDLWFGRTRRLRNIEVQDQFGNCYIVVNLDEVVTMPVMIRSTKVVQPLASWNGLADFITDGCEYWLFLNQDQLGEDSSVSDCLVTAEDLTPTDSTLVELWNDFIRSLKGVI